MLFLKINVKYCTSWKTKNWVESLWLHTKNICQILPIDETETCFQLELKASGQASLEFHCLLESGAQLSLGFHFCEA